MEKLSKVLLSAGLFLCLASTGSGYRCERETILGFTQIFNCPEPGDDPDEEYCCGFGDHKYCCSTPDEEILEEFFDNLPTVVGVIGAIILTLIVLCIVCCCCCPFCLLYKRRNQGTVRNPNPEVSVMQPLQSQPQTYAPQQQAPYPTQPVQPPHPGYPPQPAYPSQAGYPPQPYPPVGYPSDQPPMYTEKQPPPYNPTY